MDLESVGKHGLHSGIAWKLGAKLESSPDDRNSIHSSRRHPEMGDGKKAFTQEVGARSMPRSDITAASVSDIPVLVQGSS